MLRSSDAQMLRNECLPHAAHVNKSLLSSAVTCTAGLQRNSSMLHEHQYSAQKNWQLLQALLHSHCPSKLLQLVPWKRFGHDIRDHVLGWARLDTYVLHVHLLARKVVLNINVFSTLV